MSTPTHAVNNNNNIGDNKSSSSNSDALADLLTLPHTLRNQPDSNIDEQVYPFHNL